MIGFKRFHCTIIEHKCGQPELTVTIGLPGDNLLSIYRYPPDIIADKLREEVENYIATYLHN